VRTFLKNHAMDLVSADFFVVLFAFVILDRDGAYGQEFRETANWRIVSLPVVLIFLSSTLFMGYYNWRGTHDVLFFPYTVNDQTYSNSPHFIWQRASAPRHSGNPQLESLYAWERRYWEDNQLDSIGHLVRHVSLVLMKFTYFFLWPQFLFPFVLAFFLAHDIKARFFFLHFLLCFAGW
jgi:hypothetical protein